MRDETPKAISYQLRTTLDNIIRGAAPSDFTEEHQPSRSERCEAVTTFHNYEHSPGNPSPRKVEDVKFAVLEAAVLEGSNTRYGEAVSNFRDLLVTAV